jgi:hypothetical protein
MQQIPTNKPPVSKQQQAQKIARQLDETAENPLKLPATFLGEVGKQLTGDLENRQQPPDERQRIQELENKEKIVSNAQVSQVRRQLEQEIQKVRAEKLQKIQIQQREEFEKEQMKRDQGSSAPLAEPAAKQKRGMFGGGRKQPQAKQLTSAIEKASAEKVMKTGG